MLGQLYTVGAQLVVTYGRMMCTREASCLLNAYIKVVQVSAMSRYSVCDVCDV